MGLVIGWIEGWVGLSFGGVSAWVGLFIGWVEGWVGLRFGGV